MVGAGHPATAGSKSGPKIFAQAPPAQGGRVPRRSCNRSPTVVLPKASSSIASSSAVSLLIRLFAGAKATTAYCAPQRCPCSSRRSKHKGRLLRELVLLFHIPVGRETAILNSCAAGLRPQALDAALPSDFEAKALHALKKQRALTVGIVGFGTFGQFLAKRLVDSGHRVS